MVERKSDSKERAVYLPVILIKKSHLIHSYTKMVKKES